MCEPATIGLAIVSIVGALANAQQQQKTANKQAQALGVQAQNEQNAINLQSQQEAFATAEEMNTRTKAAQAEAAEFDAVAGEFGGGVTVSREAATIAFNRDHDLASLKNNRDASLSQLGQESKGAAARLDSNLASLRRPSRLGTALTIAGSATSAYASTQRPQK